MHILSKKSSQEMWTKRRASKLNKNYKSRSKQSFFWKLDFKRQLVKGWMTSQKHQITTCQGNRFMSEKICIEALFVRIVVRLDFTSS